MPAVFIANYFEIVCGKHKEFHVGIGAVWLPPESKKGWNQ